METLILLKISTVTIKIFVKCIKKNKISCYEKR